MNERAARGSLAGIEGGAEGDEVRAGRFQWSGEAQTKGVGVKLDAAALAHAQA